MRKHTGEMFFCDICNWKGTCRWKLQKHREKKHGIPPLTPSETIAHGLTPAEVMVSTLATNVTMAPHVTIAPLPQNVTMIQTMAPNLIPIKALVAD